MSCTYPDCKPREETETNTKWDRCWKEKYRGDSKPYLLRDASTKDTRGSISSAMKDSYLFPVQDDRSIVGKRRQLLQEKLTKEVAQEIIDENNRPAQIEEYCTEYDGNFHYAGYDPDKVVPRETELFLKYPLYSPETVTYYKFNIDKGVRGMTSIPGMTSIKDPKSPFKRYSGFAKDISEVLDMDTL